MKQSELKSLVKAALDRANKSAGILSDNDNPQIVELRIKREAEAKAFQAVMDALNNDRVGLKIMGEV